LLLLEATKLILEASVFRLLSRKRVLQSLELRAEVSDIKSLGQLLSLKDGGTELRVVEFDL
jgi:hypothetical protein